MHAIIGAVRDYLCRAKKMNMGKNIIFLQLLAEAFRTQSWSRLERASQAMPTSQIKRCAPEVDKWLIRAITSYESTYRKDN
jgi:hypothetical protein